MERGKKTKKRVGGVRTQSIVTIVKTKKAPQRRRECQQTRRKQADKKQCVIILLRKQAYVSSTAWKRRIFSTGRIWIGLSRLNEVTSANWAAQHVMMGLIQSLCTCTVSSSWMYDWTPQQVYSKKRPAQRTQGFGKAWRLNWNQMGGKKKVLLLSKYCTFFSSCFTLVNSNNNFFSSTRDSMKAIKNK